MSQTIDAIFDGNVLRPVEPLDIEPNTKVRLTVDEVLAEDGEPYSFLKALLSLKLKGPPDWAENFDEYRTGRKAWPDD
jgi:predicted DNA-binding antitoxin AbrB/MazE fold protein